MTAREDLNLQDEKRGKTFFHVALSGYQARQNKMGSWDERDDLGYSHLEYRRVSPSDSSGALQKWIGAVGRLLWFAVGWLL